MSRKRFQPEESNGDARTVIQHEQPQDDNEDNYPPAIHQACSGNSLERKGLQHGPGLYACVAS